MNELVIGYDARVQGMNEKPRGFFLKQVRLVKSVDSNIWPSCLSAVQWSPVSGDMVPRQDCIPVAITWVDTENVTESNRSYFQSLQKGCTPQVLPPGAVLLGYDVCDRVLLSGLTNCSYTDLRLEQARWGPKLNAVHLFATQEEGDAFRLEADLRVPEHRPFFVFGIYELAKANGNH